MLNRLQVRNFVLIDSLEIDFPEGLIIITGQTGAGKSILLGALSLVMGSKADASMISGDAENCVVEAEFDVDPSDDAMREELDENGVEWDGGHLIVRRVVNRSGRSRAFVNDSPVSVQILQSLSSRLIDVHSQHQTLLLSDKNFQLSILDHYADTSQLREECAAAWREMTAVRSELSQLEAKLARMAAEKEYNEAQYRQLEAASLQEGELEELEEEQKQLANAEEIKTCLSNAEELLTSSTSVDGMSMDSSLKEISKLLNKAGRYIPSLCDLSERVDSCRREVDDILSEISTVNSRTDLSPDRLEQVESRMSLLYGLMQKHSCQNITELISVREKYSQMLFDSTQMDERKAYLEAQLSSITSKLNQLADDLHSVRESVSSAFASNIQDSIREM
jgi:DNA repair protein RecN (Recombination protein N)